MEIVAETMAATLHGGNLKAWSWAHRRLVNRSGLALSLSLSLSLIFSHSYHFVVALSLSLSPFPSFSSFCLCRVSIDSGRRYVFILAKIAEIRVHGRGRLGLLRICRSLPELRTRNCEAYRARHGSISE